MESPIPEVVLVSLVDTDIPVDPGEAKGYRNMAGPVFPSFLLILGLAFTWFAIGFVAHKAFFVFLLFNVK